MIAVVKLIVKIPFPINIVVTWAMNHGLLSTGFTVEPTPGMEEDTIIRTAAMGTIKEPSTINLKLI